MMEIFRILDELELMVKDSKRVPLSSGKVVIDPHRFLDRIDRMRAVLPEELETARSLLRDKERIVEEACAQAEQYVEHSRGQAAKLLDENEITRNAMQMADEIMARAQQVSREIRQDANEYAEGVLTHMEIVLRRGLEAISMGKEELRQSMDE
jgi:anion-transporting  ArsA/GET3 family ATPase